MAYYNRWWLSPKGEILNVKGESHVDEILREPEKFETTREHVLETYQKYGERVGLEGQAREELMKEAMEKGWIRVRDGVRGGLYMETADLKRYKDMITDAIVSLIHAGLAHRQDPVQVMDYKTNMSMNADTAGEMMSKVYASEKGKTLRLLKIV
jgi:hypothetical protein